MNRFITVIALWLVLTAPVLAANVNIDALPAAASVGGTDLLECEQAGTNRKCTAAQTAAYVYGLMSGDATAAAGGAVTFATVNSNVGSFGSATSCVTLTVNAKGLITAASAATCTPAIGSVTGLGTGMATWLATPSSANLAAAVTGETGSGALVFATSPTLVTPALGTPASGTLTNTTGFPAASLAGLGTGVATWLATPSSANLAAAVTGETGTGALVFGTSPTIDSPTISTTATLGFVTGSTQCLHVNSTGVISGTGSDCGSGGGGTPGGSNTQVQYNNAGAFGGITGATTNGTALTLVAPVLGTPASATLTNATGLPISTGVSGLGTGVAAFLGTPSSANLATTVTDETGSGALVFATSPTLVTPALGTPASGTLTNATGLPISTGVSGLGTGVATQLGIAVSTAGGSTTTIAAGTAALGTSAISSGACATAVTVVATNTATTDTINFTPNADITAVTGYAPVTTGGLAIYPYPTANNVNFKVCNPTSSSITPGAVTLNWRVTR